MKKVRVLLATFLFSVGCLAQSPFNQSLFPAQQFTATAQTGSVIALNGKPSVGSTVGSSFGAGTISLAGTGLSTVTFAVLGSSDNGATFYALPISAVASPGSTPTLAVTATSNGLYQVSLVGITHVQFVTSGTFTATSISLILTASPNVTVSRNGGTGGGAPSTCAAGSYACLSTSNVYQGTQQAPNVNGITNAGLQSGSDIGAKANAAFALLSGKFATVVIDPTQAAGGTYAQTTTIVIPEGDTLDCQGATLTWASQTLGAAVVYGSAVQTNTPGGIKNCNLLGISNPTSSDLSIGFYSGGDPNGVLSPANNYGSYFFIENSTITGFGSGFSHGTNVWAGVIDASYLNANYNNILSSTSAAVNQGEATKITNTNIFDAANCGFKLQYAGDAYYMIGGHLDFNQGGAVCGTWADVQLVNVWIESYYGPAINVINPGVQDYISVTGGHIVLDANALTISNVAINGSNVLTVQATGPSSGATNGYWLGKPVYFKGLTTATFLNGTTGVLTGVSNVGTAVTLTLTYSHATYASAADTGTTVQYTPDLYHMEGVAGSTILLTSNHQIIAPAAQITVGSVPAQIGLGSTTQSTTCAKDNIGPQTLVSGTYLRGCQFQAGVAIQHGSTLSTIDVTGQAPLIAFQGYAINWSSFGIGDLDITNVRGSVAGGMYFCDVAANTEPTAGACQFHFDSAGNSYSLGPVHAPQTYLNSITGGPYASFFDDFLYTPNVVTAGIGSGTGQGCPVTTAIDSNHPGIFQVTSGTGTSGTGIACLIGTGRGVFNAAATQWTWETAVEPTVLPGTTAGAYQAGMTNNSNGTTSPWTSGIGFYLSSANASANHWYCQNNGTFTDSTVTATVAWHRLSMVNNGTNLLWYIDGAQVCSVAVGSVPTLPMYMAIWTAVNLNGTTALPLDVDYINFQQNVTR